MPVSGSELLFYADANKISLKYIFPEKNVHRHMLSKMPDM
jgi:hypothetical protein